jgi:ribosomal protein S18 acetylase RimI-like enzyme
MQVGPLTLEDAELVDSQWPYRSGHSLDFIKRIISTRRTAAVRLRRPVDRAHTAAATTRDTSQQPAGRVDSSQQEQHHQHQRQEQHTTTGSDGQQGHTNSAEHHPPAGASSSSTAGEGPATTLVSWAVEYEDPGAFGMLHTQEGHRQRGLGRLCVVHLLQQLLQEQGPGGGDVYCYALCDNAASIALLTSVGLQQAGVFSWMGFERSQGCQGAAMN